MWYNTPVVKAEEEMDCMKVDMTKGRLKSRKIERSRRIDSIHDTNKVVNV